MSERTDKAQNITYFSALIRIRFVILAVFQSEAQEQALQHNPDMTPDGIQEIILLRTPLLLR